MTDRRKKEIIKIWKDIQIIYGKKCSRGVRNRGINTAALLGNSNCSTGNKFR